MEIIIRVVAVDEMNQAWKVVGSMKNEERKEEGKN